VRYYICLSYTRLSLYRYHTYNGTTYSNQFYGKPPFSTNLLTYPTMLREMRRSLCHSTNKVCLSRPVSHHLVDLSTSSCLPEVPRNISQFLAISCPVLPPTLRLFETKRRNGRFSTSSFNPFADFCPYWVS
jgi:hypothetical protein